VDTCIGLGTQLIAPRGYLSLDAGTTYYFLKSCPDERVLLIHFAARPAKKIKKKFKVGDERRIRVVSVAPTPLPLLCVLSRHDFETGLDVQPGELDPRIRKADRQASLPPWLEPLTGFDLAHSDLDRPNARRRHADMIDRRIEVIYPLVMRFEELILSEDPDRLINSHARSCVPKQNETRTRLTFYVYVLFGRNRYALHYPIHAIGHWCREAHASTVKRGRPSIRRGKGSGHNATAAMIEKILDYYDSNGTPGVDLSQLYRSFMAKKLGCGEMEVNGMLRYVHPKGEPIPTRGMFKYHIRKHFGTAVQRNLYGRNRTRQNILGYRGSYSQGVCNLYEQVEGDAYAVPDLPRGLIEGHTLPALYVVRSRDVASGEHLGIGVSQGSETAAAYRMEKFCRAVPKVYFCELFGIEIKPEEWPSQGVAMHDIQDRGPGATKGAFTSDPELRPVIREMTPVRSPRSKAGIESSNPKTRSDDDGPKHFKSDKRTSELVRREIQRLIRANETINVADRIPPELLGKVGKPNTNSLYTELARRGRCDALTVGSIDDAVRSYLTVVEGKLTRDGLKVHGQLFRSEALLQSGLTNRLRGPQEVAVGVRVLDACLRYVWIDRPGKPLIRVEVVHPLRIGADVIYMSLEELRERERYLRELNADFAEHVDAVHSRTEREFEESTGKSWSGGAQVRGRPRRGSAAAKQEAREARAAMQGDITR
jgi:hypothetical protein